MTVQVLLLPLVGLVVDDCVQGRPYFVDTLVYHFETAPVNSVFIFLLLHSNVEVAILFRTINHARFSLEETSFLRDSGASI